MTMDEMLTGLCAPPERGADHAPVAATSARECEENEYLALFVQMAGGTDWLGYETRRSLVKEYAWAVPNKAALAVLSELGPLIEIGSGGGYWAHLLRLRGVDILCFDTEDGYPRTRTWLAAEHGGPEVLADGAHRKRTLFLCWPPMTPMAAECLRNYKGDRLVYIGESGGGCTADDAFHDMLDQEWTLVRTVDIPQWRCINDYMAIYERAARSTGEVLHGGE